MKLAVGKIIQGTKFCIESPDPKKTASINKIIQMFPNRYIPSLTNLMQRILSRVTAGPARGQLPEIFGEDENHQSPAY